VSRTHSGRDDSKRRLDHLSFLASSKRGPPRPQVQIESMRVDLLITMRLVDESEGSLTVYSQAYRRGV
jgi:hypothetical protein